MECVRVNEENLKWFLPLLRADIQERLAHEPGTFAIGAVSDKTACGILVFNVSDMPVVPDNEADEPDTDGQDVDETALEMAEDGSEMIEIVYLAVSDSYRRQGAATALLDALTECAKDPISVIYAYFSAPNEDDPLVRLFAGHPDFSIEERDEYVCRISHDMLADNSQLLSYRKKAGKYEEFFSVAHKVRRDFRQKIKEDAEYVFGDAEYIEPLCLCIQDGNSIKAAVFAEKYNENDLCLSYVYSEKGNEITIIGLLAEAANKMLRDYPASDLYIAAITPSSVSIVDKLFSEKEVIKHYYLTAWDVD